MIFANRDYVKQLLVWEVENDAWLSRKRKMSTQPPFTISAYYISIKPNKNNVQICYNKV